MPERRRDLQELSTGAEDESMSAKHSKRNLIYHIARLPRQEDRNDICLKSGSTERGDSHSSGENPWGTFTLRCCQNSVPFELAAIRITRASDTSELYVSVFKFPKPGTSFRRNARGTHLGLHGERRVGEKRNDSPIPVELRNDTVRTSRHSTSLPSSDKGH